jgi:hypothetical protein
MAIAGGERIPVPAVAVENGQEVLVTLRAKDYLRLIRSECTRYVTPSRREQKRNRGKISNLVRDDEDL